MSETFLKERSQETDASAIVNSYNERNMYPDRISDRGIVNEQNSSSVLIKGDGSIVLTSETTTNIKINNSKIINTALEMVDITNRKNIITDEIIINDQKLNPQVLELSDTRVLFDNPNDAIGNLVFDGTVLVKTWEPSLNKYVLIRRKIRTPLFSAKINSPEVPEFIDASTSFMHDLSVDSAALMKTEKIKKEKITDEEVAAEGGSIYDQGDYNNYLTDFIQSANSISNKKGFEGGFVGSGTSTNEIIATDTGRTILLWPVPEYHGAYTSPYGTRWKNEWHNGVDIPPHPKLRNKTKIAAAAAGKVTMARVANRDKLDTYGQVVEIQHPNGLNTLYAHLNKVHVEVGQEVAAGQHIGDMGTTGRSTGVHLHFTVWGTYNGKTANRSRAFDPTGFIKPQN